MTGAAAAPIALVTGAARRIGRAIALRLAEAGFDIAVHHRRSPAEAAEVGALVAGLGRRALCLDADLAEEGAPERLIAACAAGLGPPTSLVNNASLFAYDDLGTLDSRQWAEQLAVNLEAPLGLAKAMALRLPEAAKGSIVNILDQRVLRPLPGFLSYGVSKSALWAATRMLALELSPRIRVNAIAPGPTLQSVYQSAADFAAEVEETPLGRGPTPEEIAEAVLFISSSPAMTGQLIAIDGGQHLGAKRAPPPPAPTRAPPTPRLRHVLVDGLEVMTMIGIHPQERMRPQRVITSIDMTVEERGTPGSDRFEEVVDYERVVLAVRAICSAGHVNLVETLAERVAAACLEDERVCAVAVRIEKPDAFPDCRSVGVTITRDRSGTG